MTITTQRPRIRAVEASSTVPRANRILVLDLDASQVVAGGLRVDLTPVQFRVLRYLLRRATVTIPVEELWQFVWRAPYNPQAVDLVRVHIYLLRRRLELLVAQGWLRIDTVHGHGYRVMLGMEVTFEES